MGLPTDVYLDPKYTALYRHSRPRPSERMIQHLALLCRRRELAWDCGTGNGQVASRLKDHFAHVYASDMSDEQLAHKMEAPNIRYKKERAAECSLSDESVDLVTAGQSAHWYAGEEFYRQARRVLRPGGVVAAWCYQRPRVSSLIDPILYRIWYLKERSEPIKHVEEEYTTLPFPFGEIDVPTFSMFMEWDRDQAIAYVTNWSWLKDHLTEPAVVRALDDLARAWGGRQRDVHWEVFARVGRV